jgi:hypothetical protein
MTIRNNEIRNNAPVSLIQSRSHTVRTCITAGGFVHLGAGIEHNLRHVWPDCPYRVCLPFNNIGTQKFEVMVSYEAKFLFYFKFYTEITRISKFYSVNL